MAQAAVGASRAKLKLESALEALDEIEEHGSDAQTRIPIALTLCDRQADWLSVRPPPSPEHVAKLEQERKNLRAELRLRKRGPGGRKQYRLTVGNHARFENGVNRRYRAGSVISLTDWEAMALNERELRVELVEDQDQERVAPVEQEQQVPA